MLWSEYLVLMFAARNVTLLTAVVCRRTEEVCSLSRAASRLGVRVRAWRELTGARTPALPDAAAGAHREGVLLDLACPQRDLLLQRASEEGAFGGRVSWVLWTSARYNRSSVREALRPRRVLPDADVTWASADGAHDVYAVGEGLTPLVARLPLPAAHDAHRLPDAWARLPPAAARRRDLRGVSIRSATIVSQPQHFRGWTDVSARQIDTFPKLTYPLMMLAAEDLHFRHDLRQVDQYGVERNGSFDGLAGLLQRGEAELGVASVFMRADRWRVMHYCSETVELRGAFLFRQPSMSSVANVFLLPFSRGVWCGLGVVLLGAGALLAALSAALRTRDPALRELTPADALTFAVGTVCQQGFHVNPSLASVRLVMFSTLALAVFMFTSYSAKIVAILQTPSDAIQTIDDLARSPMELGVQETTYKKVYFEESSDAATQRLFRRKLLPRGEGAYLSVAEGVARVRTGMFAFQVEESSGYDVIGQTFTEDEKCSLKQIQAFKLPMVAVPIRKHSGYRELLAVRLRWQRESGLMSRWRRVWMTSPLRCDSALGGAFVSVRLRDVLPAAQVLGAGVALALLVLAAELSVLAARARARVPAGQEDGGN